MEVQEVIEILSGINLQLKSLRLCKEDLPKIGSVTSMIDGIIDDLKGELIEHKDNVDEYQKYVSRANAHLIGQHPRPPLPGFESPYSLGGNHG